MSNASQAARQYNVLGEHTRNAKDLEYEVFLGVTRDLANLNAGQSQDFSKRAQVLNKNERLWIEIATQVADPDNELSADVRARLFYLSEFVRFQTSKVLRAEAGLSSLIETNVAVLRGLKGQV